MGRAHFNVAHEGGQGALLLHVLPAPIIAHQAFCGKSLKGKGRGVTLGSCPVIGTEEVTSDRDAQR
eukprot:15480093-Alexandrium_andersonii.AAC.1